MSDRMTPIPFAELMNWILTERENGSVFAVNTQYEPPKGKMLNLFGEHLETPFGPAAGPHTQLAQNIIAAYYAGSRFFELKTVQTLDGEDLPVSKPCILAEDECYNVEWSTELRVQDAFAEYVKAWFAIKLMCMEYGWGDADGFIFNMSVGYDYKGIISEKIDNFIEGLKEAKNTEVWKSCTEWAKANLSKFKNLSLESIDNISSKICTSITLSTLHGCPPQEIERIASYLINTKKLNTFVKCNPTLLGYNFARATMDKMGYDYIAFDDHHFKSDLQYEDAIPMFRRLLELAGQNKVCFGLKLTNTFPVKITRKELPGEEMYMSGRSLYPLTMELARRLTEEFDGTMRISYSGGADYFNILPLFKAGIWPITMATTLLKPGGYQRFTQLANEFNQVPYADFSGVSVGDIDYLAHISQNDPRNLKDIKPAPKRKMDKKVPRFNCFTAPCGEGCPIHQDIPEYVRLVNKGHYTEALELICQKNPLPFITGTICNHRCQDKCTRNFYEDSVHIRQVKLAAARLGFAEVLGKLQPGKAKGTENIAIIGGGPGGMACAYFLGRAGMKCTIFERHGQLGGIVRYVIPQFRIPKDAIDNDEAIIKAMGCEVKTNTEAPSLDELKKLGFTHVVYATGAQKKGLLELEGGQVLNVIDFLEKYKANELKDLGKNVVVIGGGNTAMDAARCAKRTDGVEHSFLVYRRDCRNMPADEEELHLALQDGVEFRELLAPKKLENGMLICEKMVLGEPDESGRRAPVSSGQTTAVPCDTVIAAVGEKVCSKFFEKNGITLNAQGRAQVNPDTLESVSQANVFVIGDANHGPKTVVEAIADAQKAATAICGTYTYVMPEDTHPCAKCVTKRQGKLAPYSNALEEGKRCLSCSTVCECCVQVCPNRAYVPIDVEGKIQILHIDRMCNYCGNCTVFCPYDSSPYMEKISLFSTVKEFDESDLPGFVSLGSNKFKVRLNEVKEIELGKDHTCPDLEKMIQTVVNNYSYLLA